MRIDVPLTPEQERFRDEVVAFAQEHCTPEYVAERDEEGAPPIDLLYKLAERGWLAVGLPKGDGGFGGTVDIAILLEHMEQAFIQIGSLISRGGMYPATVLSHFGTADQKAELLPRVLEGNGRTVIAISEPATGSDMSALSTRAEPDGPDGWVINGEKMYMSGLDYSQFVLVAAITDPDGPKRNNVSVFLIDADDPGIEATRLMTMGAWQNRTYHGHLRDIRVGRDRLIGELNGGWAVLGGHLGRERTGIAARSVGAAQSVLDDAIAFAREREQFGQPIIEFQAIAHKLADIAIGIHTARVSTYDLARRVDTGEDIRTVSAIVKTHATEMYQRAADLGLQVWGGQGYLRSSPMQRHFRDARLLTIGGGTSEVMRNVIAKGLAQ